MILKKEFSLTGSNQKPITGDLTYDDRNPTAPLLIFVHGFKGFKDWGAHNTVADYFARNGFKFLKFNFSHNGTTTENLDELTDLETFSDNTISKELADLGLVIRFACSGKEFLAASKACLIGHSHGGGVSIIQASNDPRIDKLVTWASVAEFDKVWKKEQENNWEKEGVIYVENARTKQQLPLKYGFLKDLKENAKQLDVIMAAKRLNIPWLTVQGDADPNVGISVAKDLHASQLVSKLIVVEGADHVFGASHPHNTDTLPLHLQTVCDKTIEFLQQNAV